MLRECQNQVTDQNVKTELFFCFVFKEYLTNCPPRCSYFISGTSHSFKRVYELNMDIECTYFQQLILTKNSKNHQFICTLDNESQICSQCPLKNSQEDKISEFFSP
jgi:hypothetical protein